MLDADPIIPTHDIDGVPWTSHPSAHFLGPRMLEVEREFREIRLPLARRYGAANGLNRVSVDPSDAWIGLVATGFTYYELLDALRRLGLDSERAIADAGIRVLQLRMPVPFDPDIVRSFARGLDEIVVVEEKNPTLEWLVKDALYGGPSQPLVLGKTHEDGRTLMKSWGRLDADAMLPGLRERLGTRLGDRLAPEPPAAPARPVIPVAIARTPFFCSGCPHNWGTKVPDGALVGAGTGCHGMTLLMDEERVGETIGITAMGNEGAQWIGMEPFVAADHLFHNYGDGTYFHSAQLALQYCIGAGKHMTFKILYNDTIAMTGGQVAPYKVGVPELATILLAQGVTKVAITAEDVGRYQGVDLPKGVKVHDRTDIVAVQEDLRSTPGVTVLIHDQACAAELRRARRRGKLRMPTRRVVINHRICEGCGDCGDVSNCLSVQPLDTPLGRKTTIDQASCNFDESCLQGDCPAFMTVEIDDSDAAGEGAGAPAVPNPVPDPTVDPSADHVRVRMAGIGGTGVVTVAQIVATAALARRVGSTRAGPDRAEPEGGSGDQRRRARQARCDLLQPRRCPPSRGDPRVRRAGRGERRSDQRGRPGDDHRDRHDPPHPHGTDGGPSRPGVPGRGRRGAPRRGDQGRREPARRCHRAGVCTGGQRRGGERVAARDRRAGRPDPGVGRRRRAGDRPQRCRRRHEPGGVRVGTALGP